VEWRWELGFGGGGGEKRTFWMSGGTEVREKIWRRRTSMPCSVSYSTSCSSSASPSPEAPAAGLCRTTNRRATIARCPSTPRVDLCCGVHPYERMRRARDGWDLLWTNGEWSSFFFSFFFWQQWSSLAVAKAWYYSCYLHSAAALTDFKR
jgi:hypothetical protein